MVLVFLICIILIIITAIFFLIILSTLKVEIKDAEVSNINDKNKQSTTKSKIGKKYKIKISLLFLNKIKYISINLNYKKIQELKSKINFSKINIKKIEKEFEWSNFKEIIEIKPNISYMNLNIKLGIDDVLFTTYLIPIISTIISIFLPLVVEKNSRNKVNYIIKPIYNNGNIYDVKINIGLKIKIIKVVNAIYKIYKKRKIKMNIYKENNNNVKCNV